MNCNNFDPLTFVLDMCPTLWFTTEYLQNLAELLVNMLRIIPAERQHCHCGHVRVLMGDLAQSTAVPQYSLTGLWTRLKSLLLMKYWGVYLVTTVAIKQSDVETFSSNAHTRISNFRTGFMRRRCSAVKLHKPNWWRTSGTPDVERAGIRGSVGFLNTGSLNVTLPQPLSLMAC